MSILVTGGAGFIGGHMVLELVERGERLDERLLEEVFGIGRSARHAQSGCVQLVKERQRVALEPRPALLGGLLDGDHLPTCRPGCHALNAR